MELFASMDKAKGGVESGFVSKVLEWSSGMPCSAGPRRLQETRLTALLLHPGLRMAVHLTLRGYSANCHRSIQREGVFWLQDEVQTALESFFRVGEAGGKTLDRFDELMKVRLVGRCLRAGVTLLSAWWQYCTCRYSTLRDAPRFDALHEAQQPTLPGSNRLDLECTPAQCAHCCTC